MMAMTLRLWWWQWGLWQYWWEGGDTEWRQSRAFDLNAWKGVGPEDFWLQFILNTTSISAADQLDQIITSMYTSMHLPRSLAAHLIVWIVCNNFSAIPIKSEIPVHKLRWKTKPGVTAQIQEMSTDHCIELLLQHNLEQNCAGPKKWFFDALHQIRVICAQITLHWKANQGWERRSANLCGETGYSNVLIYARLFIEVLLQRLHWLEQNCASQAHKHTSTITQAH